MKRGIVKVKNVSGSDYAMAEIGGHLLADQAEVDLLDTELPTFYDDWEVAKQLVTEQNASQLYQDILLGQIEVVSLVPPLG